MRLEIAASRSELTRNQMNQIWYELNCLVLLVLFTKNKNSKNKTVLEQRFYNCFFFFSSLIIVLKIVVTILSLCSGLNFSMHLTNHIRNASINILIICGISCFYLRSII